MQRFVLILLVLICQALVERTDGFVVQSNQGLACSNTELAVSTTQNQANIDTRRKMPSGDLLRFVGVGETRSSPQPGTSDLLDFFRANRDLFVRDNIPYPNKNNPLVESWRKSSQALEVDVLLVEFKFGFPSLDITSSTVLGSELFYQTNLPEYQFTLLDSSLTAKGAPPLVWLFNQLISDDRIRPASITKVSCKRQREELQFVMNGNLQVDIAVPSLMKKHAKAAEQVGNQVLKSFVQKESKQGLSKFQSAYQRWRQQ